MRRSGLSEAQVRAIMAAQASRALRLLEADDVIVNNGALAELEAEVRVLHERYLALARDAAG
jgi:dephospho-CoA kinase